MTSPWRGWSNRIGKVTTTLQAACDSLWCLLWVCLLNWVYHASLMWSKDVLRFCEKTRISVTLKNLHVFMQVNYIYRTELAEHNLQSFKIAFQYISVGCIGLTTYNLKWALSTKSVCLPAKNSRSFPFPPVCKGPRGDVQNCTLCNQIHPQISGVGSQQTRKRNSSPLSWLIDSPDSKRISYLVRNRLISEIFLVSNALLLGF